jgi:lysophospholipase
MLRLADGTKLRAFRRDAPSARARGAILFLNGRADFLEKYLEFYADCHDAGWSVMAFDWRGQGGSDRPLSDRLTGHVDDFSVYCDDLAAIVAQWQGETSGPHIVIGHSMGGHILLRTLAERGLAIDAAVCTAPMVMPLAGFLPNWAARQLVDFRCWMGKGQSPAWGNHELTPAQLAIRASRLSHDPDRFADERWWLERHPALRLGAASWRWVQAAFASADRLRVPALLSTIAVPSLFLSSAHDAVVSHRAIVQAAEAIPAARLHVFGTDCRHEILREADPVRREALTLILDFLQAIAEQR